MHAVSSRLSVHPGLHDAHFAAPSMGQAAPVCATPFLHAHVFATNAHPRNCKHAVKTQWQCCGVHTLTNTLGPGLGNCEAIVAGLALCRTVHKTTRTSFRRAIIAGASVRCTNAAGPRTQYVTFMVVWIRENVQLRTNASGLVLIQSPTSVTRFAFRGAVHRTTVATVPHAVVACAHVRYTTAKA